MVLWCRRWRLVSAPSLGGLLAPSEVPSSDAYARLLSLLGMGTEVEVQLGGRLLATLSHRLLGEDTATEVKLQWAVSSHVRVLATARGAALSPSLLVQYSSSGE